MTRVALKGRVLQSCVIQTDDTPVRVQAQAGAAAHQFTSEADILAAARAGQITLINTGEVYRDSVVGGQSG